MKKGSWSNISFSWAVKLLIIGVIVSSFVGIYIYDEISFKERRAPLSPEIYCIINGVCESGESNLCSDCFNFAPTNDNVLCLYNNQSAISTQICDYYLQKRPGAKKFGVNLSGKFQGIGGHQYYHNETMGLEVFDEFVYQPLIDYIDNLHGPKITHLAVAKDVPFVLISQVVMGDGSVYPARRSAAEFLSSRSVSDYSNFNLYRFPGKHFNPDDYRDGENKPLRFAVSYLEGYNLEDIKKMIDKAQNPAAPPSELAWVLDRDALDNSYDLSFNKSIRQSIAFNRYTSDQFLVDEKNEPISSEKIAIGYIGPGIYHAFNGRDYIYPYTWMTSTGLFNFKVGNRAILASTESFNGYTCSGDITHTGMMNSRGGEQGKICDAMSSTTFGGSDYSQSFSGAIGHIEEPYISGFEGFTNAVFGSYSAGLTFGESVLSGMGNWPNVPLAIGDPLMRINDEPMKYRAGAGCSIDSDCQDGRCRNILVPMGVGGGKVCTGINSCFYSLLKEYNLDTSVCNYNTPKFNFLEDRKEYLCTEEGWAEIAPPGENYHCVWTDELFSGAEYQRDSGAICSLDSDCGYNSFCTQDLQGVLRCTNRENCYFPGSEKTILSGKRACINLTSFSICSDGVYSPPTSCRGYCTNGYCEEEIFNISSDGGLVEFFNTSKDYYPAFISIPLELEDYNLVSSLKNNPVSGAITFFENGDYKEYLIEKSEIYGTVSVIDGGSGDAIDTLIIRPGQPFMYTLSEQSPNLKFLGTRFTSPISYQINDNFELISMPFCSEKYSASDVLREIKTIDAGCNAIYKYILSENEPPRYMTSDIRNPSPNVPNAIAGDFKILPFESYFLECAIGTSFTWTPLCFADSMSDYDNDGIKDKFDNCPYVNSVNISDCDLDGIGDVCDTRLNDYDNDGIINSIDNCVGVYNPNQAENLGRLSERCTNVPLDIDSDCIPDNVDSELGDESDIYLEGILRSDFRVSYEKEPPYTIESGGLNNEITFFASNKPLIKFVKNFSTPLDYTAIRIIKDNQNGNYVNIAGLAINKTIFLNKKYKSGIICIIDREEFFTPSLVDGCAGPNMYAIECNSLTQGKYRCTQSADGYIVEGMMHSGVVEMDILLAPINLKASEVSMSSIKLNWTDNIDNEQGYKIERLNEGRWILIANLSAGITNYTDASLSAGTLYLYRVFAFNSARNSTRIYVNGTTLSSQVPDNRDGSGEGEGGGGGEPIKVYSAVIKVEIGSQWSWSNLKVGDRVIFGILGKEHSLIARGFDGSYASFTLLPNNFLIEMNFGRERIIDLNNDGKEDVKIIYNSFGNNTAQVGLRLFKIEEVPVVNKSINETQSDLPISKKIGSYVWVAILSFVFIALIIITAIMIIKLVRKKANFAQTGTL